MVHMIIKIFLRLYYHIATDLWRKRLRQKSKLTAWKGNFVNFKYRYASMIKNNRMV